MNIDLIPLKAGVNRAGGTLGLMLRITPPDLETRPERPRLNLALVIDRSGSMSGAPLEYAKLAAIKAVELLLPSDRVAVVTYDEEIHTLVPSMSARDKGAIIGAIRGVTTGGMTALHAGWVEGGTQVGQNLGEDTLNRVILLSDGRANHGVTSPDMICSDVAGLARRGVGTTAIGLGTDYNEDLLQGMADAGGGNYYFVEGPKQLEGIFEAELHGLSATVGTNVRLGIEPAGGASLREVLNDLPNEDGRLVLSNLIVGLPLEIGAYLDTPVLTAGEANLGQVVLTWRHPESGESFTAQAPLQFEALDPAAFEELPEDPEVGGYLEELRVARLKQKATAALDQGDRATAMGLVSEARGILLAAPQTARSQTEYDDLDLLDQSFAVGDDKLTRKRLGAQRYRRLRSYYHEGLAKRQADKADDVRLVKGRKGNAILEIALGDITDEAVDAIVNPTNQGLFGTGQTVDGAVHRRGGSALTRACRDIGHCEVGKAVFTEGYGLPARYVIHTAVPKWRGGRPSDLTLLESCYRASLELARRLGVDTLAFPAIGAGSNGYPLDIASDVALRVVLEEVRAHGVPETVRFVCFDVGVHEAFRKALARVGTTAPHS